MDDDDRIAYLQRWFQAIIELHVENNEMTPELAECMSHLTDACCVVGYEIGPLKALLNNNKEEDSIDHNLSKDRMKEQLAPIVIPHIERNKKEEKKRSNQKRRMRRKRNKNK